MRNQLKGEGKKELLLCNEGLSYIFCMLGYKFIVSLCNLRYSIFFDFVYFYLFYHYHSHQRKTPRFARFMVVRA